jgi:hypothetical protein
LIELICLCNFFFLFFFKLIFISNEKTGVSDPVAAFDVSCELDLLSVFSFHKPEFNVDEKNPDHLNAVDYIPKVDFESFLENL